MLTERGRGVCVYTLIKIHGSAHVTVEVLLKNFDAWSFLTKVEERRRKAGKEACLWSGERGGETIL